MRKLNLQKLFVVPLAVIALVGMTDAALAHDNDKRGHKHSDKEYSTKYRHLDDNPKYRSIRRHSHKPYGLVTIRKQYSNWPHHYGHGKAKGHYKHHQKHHHRKPVKYIYVPAYRHGHHKHNLHKYGHGRSGYSVKYFGDDFFIGFR